MLQQSATGLIKNSKSRVYYVDMWSGEVLEQQQLDFVVLNMVCNEKFGEVTVVGHRLSVQQIVNIAQVWYSDVEGARRIDLTYDSVQPDILVTDEFFESIHVHPGVCASDHLYNKSLFAYRDYPADYTDSRPPEEHAMTIMEVNIRKEADPVDWCGDPCLGTTDYRAPATGIFNREPRIPLSLAAPSLSRAMFTIDASTIIISFDRATLQGAVPVDTTYTR